MVFVGLCLVVGICCAVVSCGGGNEDVDALMRSRVDRMNKAAFTTRYNDAVRSEAYAREALAFIHDSLPEYADGRLRAWNNMATAFFNRAIHDSVSIYVDSVLGYRGQSRNLEMEQVLARLLKARLLQRQCDIAGSYQILYEIEQSGLLDKDADNMLVSLAQSEFYIITTVLNYHYRNKSQYEQAELLVEMESRREKLHCDYAEDLSFNYALAYGYYALCSDSVHQSDYLSKVLHYCEESILLLGEPTRYSTYHLANTYQMIGFLLWSRNIASSSWARNREAVNALCEDIRSAFTFDISNEADTAFAFMREATALFFLHDDPYQRLAAVVATGRYCMAHGDTATARDYFNEGILERKTENGKRKTENGERRTENKEHFAPKMEAMLYEGLLVAGCAESREEVSHWTSELMKLNNYIKQNEKADFILQQELSRANRSSVVRLVIAIVMAVLTLALLVTLILLRRRTKALQQETARLQEAQRRDVERIANVETCLSVLRHDITPFVSYLQNERLPDELRSEVTGQLIRTFENIKNWTSLSIPSGLKFTKSLVTLQDIFDNVEGSVMGCRRPDVELTFHSTSLVAVGDSQLLEIMLRNLVNNALQHTEHGSVSVEAKPYSEDKRFVHITISDSGSGMTEEQLETLFRSDKKIKVTPEAGYGSGFGLMLCRYIIKLHDDNTIRGCRIWAESELGKGSVFHFIINSKQVQ